MTIFISITAGLIVLGFSAYYFRNGGWTKLHRRVVGGVVLLYGVYLATLTGSFTSLVLPGIGGIALGAGTGAALGVVTWLVIGTVGVATGGVGIAIGAVGMSVIDFLFGGVGGASSGIGLQTVTYPLVSPLFWAPVLIIGVYILIGKRIKTRE